MHKARFSQLLPLPTDIEETREALSAVKCEQVRQNLPVIDLEKTIVMFSCKNNLDICWTFCTPISFDAADAIPY
jgi:hypothetical protein